MAKDAYLRLRDFENNFVLSVSKQKELRVLVENAFTDPVLVAKVVLITEENL
jgi:hypothetical protein